MCRRRSVRKCRFPYTLMSSSKMSVGSAFFFREIYFESFSVLCLFSGPFFQFVSMALFFSADW